MILTPPAQTIPAHDLGRVHFVGIGGAGMSGIARILLARGQQVSGSDLKDSVTLAALRALGANVHVGHDPLHLGTADTVVISTAIRADNPEVRAATERGIRVLPRAAALASVMAGRRAVAVAGTHGKTTTTSMTTVALQHCGVDPSFAIGGNLNESGANAHNGSGDLFVAEADESDGSFLAYSPTIAVVTNVEADHLDNYGTPDRYVAAFDAFVDRIVPDGWLVACLDDAGSARLAGVARERGIAVRTYGSHPDADVRVDRLTVGAGGSTFELFARGRRQGRVALGQPGRHNVLNATAAFTAGLTLGFTSHDLRKGLSAFTGTRRRFEAKGVAGGVTVVDDYAHHPTEVAAALTAAREVVGSGRIVAVFQPHLYSRTRTFATQFATSLGLADVVVVMDVYASREDPQPGVTGALIANAVPLPAGRVLFEPSWSSTPPLLATLVRPGDLLLTIGAGDVTMIGPEVLDLLARREVGT